MGYKKVAIAEIASSIKEPWMQTKLGNVDEYELKIALLEGEYYKHIHAKHDELLFVYKGSMRIEFEDEEISLNEGECIFIEKATPHKSKADKRAIVLLFEKKTIMKDYVRV